MVAEESEPVNWDLVSRWCANGCRLTVFGLATSSANVRGSSGLSTCSGLVLVEPPVDHPSAPQSTTGPTDQTGVGCCEDFPDLFASVSGPRRSRRLGQARVDPTLPPGVEVGAAYAGRRSCARPTAQPLQHAALGVLAVLPHLGVSTSVNPTRSRCSSAWRVKSGVGAAPVVALLTADPGSGTTKTEGALARTSD